MAQFKQIRDGFFIGPQPNEQDLEKAKQQGIKTVIDFRLPSEIPTSNEKLTRDGGLDYVNVPVNKASLSELQIGELDSALQQKEGPFLLHCATGARAAMLLALRTAKKNHWSAERTFEDAKSMGFDLKTSPEFSAFVTKVAEKCGKRS